jgi:hypothetical protein
MTAIPLSAESIPIDPVQTASQVMADTGAALGNVAEETAGRARTFLTAAGKAINRTIYVSCYSLSYGITFPTVLLLNIIPGGVSFAGGIVDGAREAQKYVSGLQSQSAAAKRSRTKKKNSSRATPEEHGPADTIGSE